MKALHTLYRIISHACIIFTCLALALYTAGMIVSGSQREWIPTLSMMYSTLAFSLLFSAVNDFAAHSRVPLVLKVLIHYAATMLIFYVLFIRWGNYSGNSSGTFLILGIFSILYAIGLLIFLMIRSVRKVQRNQSADYNQQFQLNSQQKKS